MVGTRDRIHRRRSSVNAVVCAGHQELRDIVIETRTDVKYILKSLKKGTETMDDLDTRVDTLETAEASRAENKNQVKTAKDNRVTIVSLVIGAAGVLVATWAVFWQNKGP
jgi:hypothetical protein